MTITHEGPTKPTRLRRRRTLYQRIYAQVLRHLRYTFDVHYARRSDAGKKAAQTRRARRAEKARATHDYAMDPRD